MAQGDKHFVQTTLNEGSYTPFPYFYDLTGWSAMILENVPGGWSATELSKDVLKQNATWITAKEAAARARLKLESQPLQPSKRAPPGLVRTNLCLEWSRLAHIRQINCWLCVRRCSLRAQPARARATTGSPSSSTTSGSFHLTA